ncbi:DNA-directed RNA polymerase I subunit 1 [Linum grandiflorum]
MDNPQTVLLGKVLQANLNLANAHANKGNVIQRWLNLQQSINILFDSKSAKGPGEKELSNGICQILEKKEGLFRQKMMGKRVNYACRSVISPDPYLGVNEIGIPPCFAIKLTYPERVTPWNVAKLRTSVINGPDNYPGATHLVDKQSINRLQPCKKSRMSISRKLPSSTGALKEPGKHSDCSYEGKTVYRHLQDGDIVLCNRQPTLHKPSIMAHVVKVLKGEKTLRMHYANCGTYNADFDGDEMNVHFPQDDISRAEGYNIVNANNQYVKPSNGEPLRSLIQDHIISSVLLTMRDTFLTIEVFYQLLYICGVFSSSRTSFNGKYGQKVFLACSEDDFQIAHPAVLKPFPLWTGKQVITAILNLITKGRSVTVEKDAKISSDFFRSKSAKHDRISERSKGGSFQIKPDEEKILVSKNELLRGVIDKAQFGEYGLVHTVQELFGSEAAGTLLSVLSRLFTGYLQMHAFTCGVDDLLIMKDKDDARKRQLEGCEKDAELVHRHFIGIKDETLRIEPKDLQFNIEKIMRSEGESAVTYLDNQMRSELNSKTNSGVISGLLSEGAVKPSVHNCIYLMTTSGAKGSKVNFQQISSFLGQQELEGKRVPRMVSGKTLPSFHPWDWAARAGGFIIDRFLTGLRPQEYYFHCMAGREGLVDTAVKTSRSGYLQRCLIKNLECLRINYDHTVRDADGSIIQFQYGEDGVDVSQTSFLAKFDSLAKNQEVIFQKCGQQPPMFNSYISELPKSLKDKADNFLDESSLMDRISSNLVKKADIHRLMELKFLLSLAQPGEPVGVLAAQSVGEPSTQMTLNTFHLAGRGEANVTLGIPRLQEILMMASSTIQTPIMTCPLKEGKTKEVAERLAEKFRKVRVADIVKSMEVSVTPFAVQDWQACRIYKLKMQLHRPAHYPEHAKIDIEDWEETLEGQFVRGLEDAIQNHLILLSKISGIAAFVSSKSKTSGGDTEEEDASTKNKSSINFEDDNDGDGDSDAFGDGEETEDLGADARKQKSQTTEDVDYEDNDEDDHANHEGSVTTTLGGSGFETGSESDADDAEPRDADDDVVNEGNSGASSKRSSSRRDSPAKTKDKSNKTEVKSRKLKRTIARKDYDRAIFVEAKGFQFEVHFKFTNEPHILLSEIAQKVSKVVFIQNPGKIEQCRATDCKDSQVIYYGKDPTNRVAIKPDEKKKIPALQAMGVDINSFWKMQKDLDIRYIYSNDIHSILNTYGVEAAREAIIREINHVFGSYGISVSNRHLSLIADYMTHTGEYRPLSRLGGISKSVSPFTKMSFETASKFIVQAALHGETDYLEAPSARLCLGLPVKMGTGSFDVMHNLEIS